MCYLRKTKTMSRLDYGPPPASDPDDELLNDSFEIATLEDDENQVNILTLTENEYDEYYKQNLSSAKPAIANISCRSDFVTGEINVLSEAEIIIPTENIQQLQENCTD